MECSSTLWLTKTTRSRVEVSAQCRSSSTSRTGAAAARSASSASVSSNTCSCEPAVWRAELAERTQRFDERLVRQLRADEIDRAPEQDVEPRVAGPIPELGREAGLADPCVPGEEDGRPASVPGSCERALQLSELTCAPEERCVLTTHHRSQYCAAR